MTEQKLGAHYELLEVVGHGGSGTVWRARDDRTGDVVAAKILRPEYVEDPDVVSRFIRERTILTSLSGENIVAVRDLVVEGNTLAVVQEFVPGRTLRAVLNSGISPLTPFDAATVTMKVLDALEIAHASHVVHRDVKPDNVMVDEPLFSGAVKLTDFGISAIISEGNHTSTSVVGTPAYMPPELIRFGTASFAGDVYSTGIMLYELLAGRTPFAGSGTDFTISHRQLTAAPPELPVDGDLWALVKSMLAKRAKERPTANEARTSLADMLSTLTGQPALETQETPDDFPEVFGPETVLRPRVEHDDAHQTTAVRGGLVSEAVADESAATQEALPDPVDRAAFGEANAPTVLRPEMPVSPEPSPEADDAEATKRSLTARQKYIVWAVTGVLAAAAIVAGVFFYMHRSSAKPTEPFSVSMNDDKLPTGLQVSRTASFNPETQKIDYTVTYSADTVPLAGPFLESIVGTGGSCPDVKWEGESQSPNLEVDTNIETTCGWAIDPGPVAPDHPASVTGHFALDLKTYTKESLKKWLARTASTTNNALANPKVHSTAYAAQRLSGIDAEVPQQIESGKPVPVNIYPVWPSGKDTLNPIYVSPNTGRPTATFQAVSGGEKNLQFSDRCIGATAVSRSGTDVTALRPAEQCTLEVDLGNFQKVETNSFDIVTHGS